MRIKGCIGALLVALSGAWLVASLGAMSSAVALAQPTQKVATEEDLDKSMKAAQKAMQGIQGAMKAGAPEDARKSLASLREIIESSREFWVTHKKDDAIKANQEAVAKIDAADKVLGSSPVDTNAAAAALKEVGGACLTCHKAYRVRDAENNWVLKPGSIGG